jgi:hypothetical protein
LRAPAGFRQLFNLFAAADFRTTDLGLEISKKRKGDMPFTFTCNGKCAKCGFESFTSSQHPADYAPVTCLGCGHVTTVNNAIRTHRAADPGTKPFLNRE